MGSAGGPIMEAAYRKMEAERDALNAALDLALIKVKEQGEEKRKLVAEVTTLKGVCVHQRVTLQFLEGAEGAEDGAELHACDARREEFEKLEAEVTDLRHWIDACDKGPELATKLADALDENMGWFDDGPTASEKANDGRALVRSRLQIYRDWKAEP
jgi:hypothetical protein